MIYDDILKKISEIEYVEKRCPALDSENSTSESICHGEWESSWLFTDTGAMLIAISVGTHLLSIFPGWEAGKGKVNLDLCSALSWTHL